MEAKQMADLMDKPPEEGQFFDLRLLAEKCVTHSEAIDVVLRELDQQRLALSIRIEWSIMLLGFLITDVEDMEVFFNLPLNI